VHAPHLSSSIPIFYMPFWHFLHSLPAVVCACLLRITWNHISPPHSSLCVFFFCYILLCFILFYFTLLFAFFSPSTSSSCWSLCCLHSYMMVLLLLKLFELLKYSNIELKCILNSRSLAFLPHSLSISLAHLLTFHSNNVICFLYVLIIIKISLFIFLYPFPFHFFDALSFVHFIFHSFDRSI
jgi:hypothetical protein